jgi:FMN phosphatase YigB (HAD superfamily)
MATQNKIILFDIDDTMFNTALLKESDLSRFEMYEDVYDALEDLSDVASLGIFSQGEIAFQLKKLKETNIHHYFEEEHTFIVEDKLEVVSNLLKKYVDKGQVFLVEDRLDVLKMAKECYPKVYTVWMKRGRYVENQRNPVDYTPDATVTDLHQVVPIIANS